ncbi:putative Carotenoid isomerase, chloroplast precursor [Hibiscus syriacus]|uniref:Carotenoid isomerase, chloroplast n=1 Tax=Hibiscus syriacus TaxID=106335 RepID=A0A6A2X9G0_HIBSY|nr:uncharacterized protein LOC120173150 [Hibiscus syriacus]KAE8671668.1 putative Carotenoid isomerase, chloroplast precursor [Hibiscus syriacus]
METGSLRLGLMAVFAVSGSVVFIAHEVHKRLLSDFMKKIEFELAGNGKCQVKKRVRFADDVREPSSNNKEYRKRNLSALAIAKHAKGSGADRRQLLKMPLNRQVLYKGILQCKAH